MKDGIGRSGSVTRYRSIEDMPRPWRAVDDPENLRVVAQMLALYRSLGGRARGPVGVTRFRSIEDANAADDAARKSPQ